MAGPGVTKITARVCLEGDDLLDWSGLGPNGTAKTNPFGHSSDNGLAVQVSKPAAQTDDFRIYYQTTGSWQGNFTSGDAVLYTGSPPNLGPIAIEFAAPVQGAGVQIQRDSYNDFTAIVQAYDSAGAPLGSSFTLAGSVPANTGDGSAIFLGVLSGSEDIARIEFSLQEVAGFGINQVQILDPSGPPATTTTTATTTTAAATSTSAAATTTTAAATSTSAAATTTTGAATTTTGAATTTTGTATTTTGAATTTTGTATTTTAAATTTTGAATTTTGAATTTTGAATTTTGAATTTTGTATTTTGAATTTTGAATTTTGAATTTTGTATTTAGPTTTTAAPTTTTTTTVVPPPPVAGGVPMCKIKIRNDVLVEKTKLVPEEKVQKALDKGLELGECDNPQNGQVLCKSKPAQPGKPAKRANVLLPDNQVQKALDKGFYTLGECE